MRVVIAKVDEVVYDGEAQSVTVPGAAGEMTILGHHEPLVTTLKKGTVTVRTDSEHTFQIEGGVLEVNALGATILL